MKRLTEIKSRPHNSRFAKAGVSCFYDSEVLNSNSVPSNPRLSQCFSVVCKFLKEI